ncbi:hypothetical protein ACFLW0_03285 [Chloroflexota bacterium]
MASIYEIGQKVAIKSVSEQDLSVRTAALQPYVGQIGEITNYHWIEPPNGKVFYLYTVQVGDSDKEIVLYEDEIKPV